MKDLVSQPVRWTCLFLVMAAAACSHRVTRGIDPATSLPIPALDPLDTAADVFFAGPIQRFQIQVPSNTLASLRKEPRTPVPLTVVIGTNRFDQVSIHVKGSAGSSRPVDDYPALTLNFGRLNGHQTAYGLHKLHLNNSVQDPSRMDELVASTLYREMGVPTARTTHARVLLNDRDLGLYVLKEGYDKAFVRRNFPVGGSGDGQLYDGGFLRDIDQDLNREVGRGTNDYAALKRLRSAVNLPPGERAGPLGEILDMDSFLNFCAIQSITDDWDGYARNRNNYRLYYEPVKGRFHFIPHGMDQLFANPEQPIEPGWGGVVAQRVMEVPEFRQRYLDAIRVICARSFTSNRLEAILAPAVDRMEAAMADRPEPERRELLSQIASLRERLFARVAHLRKQLAVE